MNFFLENVVSVSLVSDNKQIINTLFGIFSVLAIHATDVVNNQIIENQNKITKGAQTSPQKKHNGSNNVTLQVAFISKDFQITV